MKQVLDFIKAHTAALSCALVALLALIAYFVYPIPSFFTDLDEKVKGRQPTYSGIDTLLKEERPLPKLDPAVADPGKLASFPAPAAISAATDAIAKLKEQSAAVLAAAVKLNAKPVLRSETPGALDPLPKPPALARQQFYERYREVTQQSGEGAKKGVLQTVLHGTLPPTQEELAIIAAARTNEIRRMYEQRDATGQVVNEPVVTAEIAKMMAELPLEQKRYRAQNFQIYVSPGGVQTHPAMQAPVDNLDAVAIFNAQYSLWVQMTVFEAIVDANNGSKNVYDSPVKHLVRLNVPLDIGGQSTGGPGIGFGSPPPDPSIPVQDLKPDASVAITPTYIESPLGYTHNSMYDPIRVELVVRVDYRRLPEVLARLGKSRLVKVRNVSYRTVESAVALSNGYLYDRDGRTPLVEVTLDCDVLMLREWVVRYMPDSVKAQFQQMSNPVQPAG